MELIVVVVDLGTRFICRRSKGRERERERERAAAASPQWMANTMTL